MSNITEEIKNHIGIELYPKNIKRGGQHCGLPIRGVRLWYPKEYPDEPDIDIRIRTERSQLKNKDLGLALIELILDK